MNPFIFSNEGVKSMYELLKNLIFFHPEITILGAITLIQITPIKINPWTAVCKFIKKLLIGDIETKLDGISDKVNTLEKRVKEERALQARTQILRFADELYNGDHHSKEYFDDVLDNIDMYEKYCKANPDFKNNKTVMSAGLIKDTYNKLFEQHKF